MWVIPMGITHIVYRECASAVHASRLRSGDSRSVPPRSDGSQDGSAVTLRGDGLASHVTKLLYVTFLINDTDTVAQFPLQVFQSRETVS